MQKHKADVERTPATVWQDGNGVTICFTVRPGAKKDMIIKEHNCSIRVDIRAAPERGKANEALLRFIASTFNKPLSSVTLRQGHSSHRKLVSITDVTLDDAQTILASLIRRT